MIQASLCNAAVVLLPLFAGVSALLAQEAPNSSAGEAVEAAIRNVAKQEGFRTRISLDCALGPDIAPLSASGDGWVRNPDMVHSKVSSPEVEYYRKGNVSVHRDAMGEWGAASEGIPSPFPTFSDPIRFLDQLKNLCRDAVRLEDKKVGDLDCVVYEVTATGEAARPFIGEGIPEEAVDWTRVKLTLRLWVEKADALLRKVTVDCEVWMGEGLQPGVLNPLPLKIVFEVVDYNKEVGLDKIPTAVWKKLNFQSR